MSMEPKLNASSLPPRTSTDGLEGWGYAENFEFGLIGAFIRRSVQCAVPTQSDPAIISVVFQSQACIHIVMRYSGQLEWQNFVFDQDKGELQQYDGSRDEESVHQAAFCTGVIWGAVRVNLQDSYDILCVLV